MKMPSPAVRKWIYSVALVLIPLLVFYGLISDDSASLWVALVGAILTPGLAIANVKPAETPATNAHLPMPATNAHGKRGIVGPYSATAPDQGAVLSAVTDYANAVAAQKVADQKAADDATLAQVKATDAAALATANAKIAELQAIIDAENPPPVDPPVDPPVAATTIIGMSAPASQWSQRLTEVGKTGVTARRIFADLAAGATDQQDLIKAAFDAGLMPVVSYKVGGDYAGAKSGKYDAAATAAAAYIASFKRPAKVVVLHEPQGDLSGPDFEAIQLRLASIFQSAGLSVGCFLNGWLLDSQAETTFASFATPKVLALLDWVGIDTYESGTMDAPGKSKPADRIPELVAFLKKRGITKRIGIGEYNGYSAKSIADCGEAILSTPEVEFACLWNSTVGKGYVLTNDRLAAFKTTLADPRTAR